MTNSIHFRVCHKDVDDAEETRKAYEAIKGSWSTKIRSVVSQLLKIQAIDPEAKSLVFSTWPEVLDILSTALTENNINFATLHAQGKFKRNLEKFKVRPESPSKKKYNTDEMVLNITFRIGRMSKCCSCPSRPEPMAST